MQKNVKKHTDYVYKTREKCYNICIGIQRRVDINEKN